MPGKRVLVLDGDAHFMGIALAELMANQGKEVTYVCDASDVAEYGVFTMESFNNKRMLFEKRIKTYMQPLGRRASSRARYGSAICTSSVPTWSGPRAAPCRAGTTAASSILRSMP